MRAKTLGALVLSVALVACSPYLIPFWTEHVPPTDPRVVAAESAPCGAIAMVRLKNMREVRGDPDLEPDYVYELGLDERIIGEWQVPANVEPLAVAGDRMYVAGYWVGKDGSLARRSDLRLPEPEFLANCRIPEQLQPTEYGQCVRLTDLQTGAKRLMAYNAPCS